MYPLIEKKNSKACIFYQLIASHRSFITGVMINLTSLSWDKGERFKINSCLQNQLTIS